MTLSPTREEVRPISLEPTKLVTAIAATIAMLIPHSAHAKTKQACQKRACFERVAIRKCSQKTPRWCVKRAIVTYRLNIVQAAWMHRVAACESGYRWWAKNPSGSTGLYQFLPSTWATLPYADHSIYSAKWQSLAAAAAVRAGRTGEWACR